MREDSPDLGLDADRPNIARVYDYWLGGKDNFAADRELAAGWPTCTRSSSTSAPGSRATRRCTRPLGR